MIIGFVTPAYKPLVRVEVRGRRGTQTVEAVVDTGFNGFLTLPPDVIGHLQLQVANVALVTLADGREVELSTYEAGVLWDGAWQNVEVMAVNSDSLIGMALLHEYSLRVEVIDGGGVVIEKINV